VTGFMHDVASASLPVAIGLLALAATARAVLWARLDHAPAQRLAQHHLEPLSTWCLVAVAVNTAAVGAAGDAGVVSLALPLCLGVAAVMLRSAGERDAPAAAAPAKARPRPAPGTTAPAAPAPPAPPAPAPAAPVPAAPTPPGSLWADETDDEATRRAGLWSRA
jgi:hypothetical protein